MVQAVTVVQKDEDGKQVICAFYTENKPVPVGKIKLAVSDRLPFYMVPGVITRLPQIPLTSNGKIDYKRLPKVDLRRTAYTTEYLKPEGEIERQLALIVKKVLNYSPIGRDDNFFELGGDSLGAIEFVSRAHDNGLYFSLQDIFDFPTVRQLSENIINSNKKKNPLDSVDFTQINKILQNNKVENISIPQKSEIGNILLTGATGFLGIHILADYLENHNGIVYCLVRGRNEEESRNRLSKLLGFYFGDRFSELIRIKVICADLQKDYFGISKREYEELLCNVTMVVNTAASVKHYGSYQYFYEANVETVKRLIKFCIESGAKLVHTSTLSVSGNGFSDVFDGYISKDEKHFYENNLYIGQPLDNVYARSKFEAEKLIFESIEQGLCANIMRIGNLTSRLRDGVFQKNHETNAFLGRVKGILELGVFPDYLMDIYVEFTPVDKAASAIIKIMEYFNMEHIVFHINNNKVIYMDKLLQYLRRLDINLEVVHGAKFANALQSTMKQRGKEYIFEAFVNDMNPKEQLRYDSNIHIENDFTVKYLRQLNFEWDDVDFEYLSKYVAYLKGIGYLCI